MKQFNFTVAVTLLILISMQVTSALAVFKGLLDIKEYLALWAPVLTLVVGYWFRGAQTTGVSDD